ncbi:cupredoxin domain-containing protein [Thalassotalea castellviae]|uniref:cupredoxin domain-containing protein n=1 Tax=Thalassotalea castellviae TaxID=3075612 RepID=UPI0032C233D0
MFKSTSLIIGFCMVLLPFTLLAKTKEFYLTIENHIFSPSELTIPANSKVKLIIYNKDNVSEEFDSFDLNREKVLFPGRKTTIFVGPLSPGRYEYFGEYHPNIARGVILVEVNNAN